MNICIRDYLAPSMALNQSDVSMFDYQHVTFIIATLLGIWDFKLTLFVYGPIYLVGFYFFLSGIKNLSGDERADI